MIIGPQDSGKSTLSHILSAYAVRLGREPLLVDLDVGQNSLGLVLNIERDRDRNRDRDRDREYYV